MGIFLQVALGGAIGAVLRYAIGLMVVFPFGTLFVNVLGSFLIGVAYILLADRSFAPLVTIGVLGGFTTFSTFSLDVLKLVENGAIGSAMGYTAGSLILSICAVFLGVALARGLG